MKKLIRKSVWPITIVRVIFLAVAGATALRNASAILGIEAFFVWAWAGAGAGDEEEENQSEAKVVSKSAA